MTAAQRARREEGRSDRVRRARAAGVHPTELFVLDGETYLTRPALRAGTCPAGAHDPRGSKRRRAVHQH